MAEREIESADSTVKIDSMVHGIRLRFVVPAVGTEPAYFRVNTPDGKEHEVAVSDAETHDLLDALASRFGLETRPLERR